MFVGPRCFVINVAVLHWFLDSHFFLSYHQLVFSSASFMFFLWSFYGQQLGYPYLLFFLFAVVS